MKDVSISNSVVYIGCDDKDIDLFESQYIIPEGMAYNSYVVGVNQMGYTEPLLAAIKPAQNVPWALLLKLFQF